MTFLTGGTGAGAKLGLAAVPSRFAAVESLLQSLALDPAPIRVNTSQPGGWTTVDIRHAAVFLMTNSYVMGTALEISGGELLVALIPVATARALQMRPGHRLV
ncbi:hypothetical protein [Acidisphaera sp. L21]|uniref:hypothetical protein n=1 Tax=Acidisphaera sp. L21 TaxID=1641851 RepID=UPI001C2020ED|nr:hypothetical protein [Acidisphaera sp. L21]